MANYMIYAPAYSKSAGVNALYSLSRELEKKGYTAPVLSTAPHKDFHCISDFTSDMQQNDIVVYPEIVRGNPLKFSRVVRYILYFPGKLGGERLFDTSELLITWDKSYYAGVPELSFDLIDRTLFFDAKLPKTQDCVFIYKNGKWKDLPELNHLPTITMQYPETKKELAHLLQTTDTLYSYDAYSMLLAEACLCGARVKIVTDDGFKEFIFRDNFDQLLHEKQLETFIEHTQNMRKTQPKSDILNISYVCLYGKFVAYTMLNSVCKSSNIARKLKKYRWKLGRPI